MGILGITQCFEQSLYQDSTFWNFLPLSRCLRSLQGSFPDFRTVSPCLLIEFQHSYITKSEIPSGDKLQNLNIINLITNGSFLFFFFFSFPFPFLSSPSPSFSYSFLMFYPIHFPAFSWILSLSKHFIFKLNFRVCSVSVSDLQECVWSSYSTIISSRTWMLKWNFSEKYSFFSCSVCSSNVTVYCLIVLIQTLIICCFNYL